MMTLSVFDQPDIETNANGGKQSRLATRLDLLPPRAMLCLGEILSEGAAKYDQEADAADLINWPNRNWHRISANEHVKHALEHIVRYLDSQGSIFKESEYHLGHAMCRLVMAVEIDQRGGACRGGDVPLDATTD